MAVMVNLEKLRTDFFLSMSGISLLSAFSTITCIIKYCHKLDQSDHEERSSADRRVEAYWNSVRVLLSDPVSLRLPLLYNTRHVRLRVQ